MIVLLKLNMEEEIENLDYSCPNLFTKEKISTDLEYARTVEPRSHMIELKHYPTMFAIIEMKEDGTHNLHIRRQDAIIEEPISAQAFIDLGYNWYIEDARDGPQNLYSIEDFRLLHNHITNKIDDAISNHHGIVCTTTPSNQHIQSHQDEFVLHIGDILICKLAEIENQCKPQLFIKTSTFNQIPDNMVDNLFLPILNNGRNLSEDEVIFLMLNTDFYFHIYCYWKNFSNKPIRCAGYGLNSLRRSQNLLKNPNYQGNQITKLDALNRRCQGDYEKQLYLVNY